MNTTYGHQTDTVLWQSPNGRWSIERRTVYNRSGTINHQSHHIYSASDGVLWPINASTAENTFYPKYVRRAIAQHVKE